MLWHEVFVIYFLEALMQSTGDWGKRRPRTILLVVTQQKLTGLHPPEKGVLGAAKEGIPMTSTALSVTQLPPIGYHPPEKGDFGVAKEGVSPRQYILLPHSPIDETGQIFF